MIRYPKRLIEVDLPIKRISAHARREKSIRHGHISTLHIWWARRPLAACRAVICAALWPDPADKLCPQDFRDKAAKIIMNFARKAATDKSLAKSCSPDIWEKWNALAHRKDGIDPTNPAHLNVLRFALLDFIADFSNWDNSTQKDYLETSRALTQAAHEALGGAPGTKPLVVDPFAGGGSIPLEALRVGADAFASDLNPVAVLLNKVVLEYIPKYGKKLAEEVRMWGEWVKKEAEKELAEFYPKDPDGATPIAYLWARMIKCEGPGCGAEVPLLRSLWLAKKDKRSVALKLIPDPVNKRVNFDILSNPKANDVGNATVARGAATCPCCGYTTPVDSVRRQLKKRRGGTADALMFAVVTTCYSDKGRSYRLPTEQDINSAAEAAQELERRKKEHKGPLSLVPNEQVNPLPHSVNRLPIYGMEKWGDVHSPRQALALTTFLSLIQKSAHQINGNREVGFTDAVITSLALALDRQANALTSVSRWNSAGEKIEGIFARQAIALVWDFAEANPFSSSSGCFENAVDWVSKVLEYESYLADEPKVVGQIKLVSATAHPLPDDLVQAFITDPPYFDMISYADLSDFFYVWLRRVLVSRDENEWQSSYTPKANEIIVEPTPVEGVGAKDKKFYLTRMTEALTDGRRIVAPNGISTIVFAHKSTSGWEALLQALLDAGWVVSGS